MTVSRQIHSMADILVEDGALTADETGLVTGLVAARLRCRGATTRGA
jgi:hypothetical protein